MTTCVWNRSNLLARAIAAGVLLSAGALAHAETDASASRFVVASPSSATFTGDVPVRIELGSDVVADTVRLRLNGAVLNIGDVTPADDCDRERGYQPPRHEHAGDSSPHCRPGVNVWRATLESANGLKAGENRLTATAINADGSLDAETVSFFYVPNGDYRALGDGGTPSYMPKSIGITVAHGGAEPWVKITTGWPQPSTPDPDTNLHPYYDVTLPLSTDTACSSTDVYQVVVLDRKTPTTEIAYQCFGTDAALTAYLKTLTNDQLVIAGTLWLKNAGPALDTSAIGGTNYTVAGAPHPNGYATVGVGGATPGTAFESYYTPDDPTVTYTYSGYVAIDMNPHATGTLNYDMNGNYNFVSAEAQQLTVTPGDPAKIELGGQTYTSETAQNGSHNGFYLLIVDRVALRPIYWNGNFGASCRWIPIGAPNQCGIFYPTGDDATSAAAVDALTAALNSVTSRQIAILTTVGQPLRTGADMDDAFAASIAKLGGTYYTMQRLGIAGNNFTLVADGPSAADIAKNDNKTSPFAKGVVEATNLFTQQQQSGVLNALFARDQSGLYYAMQATQEAPAAASAGLPADYSYHVVSTAANGDWPMTDTAGHIAAYHYISNQYLAAYPLNLTGAAAYDLRYHYSSLSEAIESNADWFEETCPSMSNADFTATEYCDVWNQLKSEIAALSSTRKLLGDNGLRGIFTRSIAPDAIAASYTIHEGQFTNPPNSIVDMNIANWLKMAGAIDSLVGNFAGPLAPIFSVSSSMLNIGSDAYSLMAWKPGDPVQFESAYDVTLGQTDAYATLLTQNLPSAYDASANMVYSDWTKLKTVAAKADDTSSGWQVPDGVTADAISAAVSTGAQRALYLQLLPQNYSIDLHTAQPVSTITLLGSINEITQSCNASYPNITSNGYDQKWALGTGGGSADYLVLAGVLDHNQNYKMQEHMPSQALVDELFADPATVTGGSLNLPKDLVFSDSSYLPVRDGGGMYSSTYCYKIPCYYDLHLGGEGICIGP